MFSYNGLFDPGMLLPASMPNVSDELAGWAKLTYPQLCEEILALFVGDDIPRSDLKVKTASGCDPTGIRPVLK
jgi:threonine synthase